MKTTWWRCFRCPLAFDSSHRPKDVHIISEGLFLCIRHIQEDEDLPELTQELIRRIAVKERLWSEVMLLKPDDSSLDQKEKEIRDRILKERRQTSDRASRMRDLLRRKAAAETGDDGNPSTSDIEIKKKRIYSDISAPSSTTNDDDDSDDDDVVGRGGKSSKGIKSVKRQSSSELDSRYR